MDFNGSVVNLLMGPGNPFDIAMQYIPFFLLSICQHFVSILYFEYFTSLRTYKQFNYESSKTASECKVCCKYVNKYTIGGKEAWKEGKE